VKRNSRDRLRDAVADVILGSRVRTYDMNENAGRPEVINSGAGIHDGDD